MANQHISGNLQVDGVVQITDKIFFGNNRIMNYEGVFFFQNNANTPEQMTTAPILVSKLLLGRIGGPRIESVNDKITVIGDIEFSGSINLI